MPPGDTYLDNVTLIKGVKWTLSMVSSINDAFRWGLMSWADVAFYGHGPGRPRGLDRAGIALSQRLYWNTPGTRRPLAVLDLFTKAYRADGPGKSRLLRLLPRTVSVTRSGRRSSAAIKAIPDCRAATPMCPCAFGLLTHAYPALARATVGAAPLVEATGVASASFGR